MEVQNCVKKAWESPLRNQPLHPLVLPAPLHGFWILFPPILLPGGTGLLCSAKLFLLGGFGWPRVTPSPLTTVCRCCPFGGADLSELQLSSSRPGHFLPSSGGVSSPGFFLQFLQLALCLNGSMPCAAVYFMIDVTVFFSFQWALCRFGSLRSGSRVLLSAEPSGVFVFPKSRPLSGTLGNSILSNTEYVP